MQGPTSLSQQRNTAKTSLNWFLVGTLIDGVSRSPIHSCHLVFDSERILHVGATPPDPELVDHRPHPDEELPHHFALPCLIEAHAHLFLEGGELDLEKRKNYLKLTPTLLLSKAILRLEKLLKLGIGAYRDAGDNMGIGLALSKLYRSPSHPAMPYVESPGAAINHAGRYGSFMSEAIENHPNLEAVIANRVAAGADRIKLIPTGIINFKKGAVTAKPQMTLEELETLVAAAKLHRKQTFAHASGDVGIDLAIEARVDSIEHGFFVRDDQLAKLRDHDIAWVPTFAPVQIQVDEAERFGWEREIVDNLKRILDHHAASLAKAQEMGIKIIAGSDAGSCGVAHGLGLLYELELMERAGLSPLQVINSATGTSAGRLNYSEDFGSLETGKKSRIILTEHDITKSVSKLRMPKKTYFDGKVHHSNEGDSSEGL